MNTGTGKRMRCCSWLAGTSLGLAAMALSGCDGEGSPYVLSLEPLYKSVDLETDSRLNGTWRDSEGEVTFWFECSEHKGEETAYKLVVKEKEGEKETTGEFDAGIVRLGAWRFLDLYPKSNTDGSEFYRDHFVRGHAIIRVEIKEDSLEMAFFSTGWLRKAIKEKRIDIPHADVDDALVLTGETDGLQELVFSHANDDEAFGNPVLLQRQRGGEEGQ